MPNLKGSDELFRLIHSLSAEEKGYFKKFTMRHTSHGNNYLLLFDAISRQKSFDERVLKERFNNYTVMKVYLKDMITDCLLLYYRNTHAHIHLLNQLQKIHLLIIKGFNEEAIKLLEKLLVQTKKMEIFSIERYLLRMYMELCVYANNKIESIAAFLEDYTRQIERNKTDEADLTEFEMMSLDWFIKFKKSDWLDGADDLDEVKKTIGLRKPRSKRAEMRKLITLNWIGLMQNDIEGVYKISHERFVLANNFKQNNDPALNTVPVLHNHIINCMRLKKFKEAEALCKQMIEAESKEKLYYDLAFVLGNIYKITSCYETAQFKKGLSIILSVEVKMDALQKSKKDETWNSLFRGYKICKLIFLFVNKKFQECWHEMQESYRAISQDVLMLPNMLLLDIMIQIEFGNFELANEMAKKAEKKIQQKNLNSPVLVILFQYFKKVKAENLRKLSFETSKILKKHFDEKKLPPFKLFGVIDYTHWLATKSSDTSLESMVKAALKK
jgi:hypothetical protein